MVSPQPVFSLKYFQFHKNKLPKNVKRLFYLSWEDGLWDILIKKKIEKGSYILTPDFYCADVEKNILLHGYKIINYKFNKDLSVDKNDFENKINKFDPKVIVIFHPVGIKTNLIDNVKWLKKVTGLRVLVEDCVHGIIDPKEVNIIKKDHFIIDSLRKVLPLQGSNVYGRAEDLEFLTPPFYQSFFYSVKVNILWFLMVLAWSLKLGRMGEKLMLRGYSLIGDSTFPASGSFISNILSIRINIKKIRDIKKRQSSYYEKKLGSALPQKLLISERDKGNLRGYPLILPGSIAPKVLKSLRDKGLLVRFELNDSDWSKRQKIIYLPLGVYMTKRQQAQVTELSYNILNAQIK